MLGLDVGQATARNPRGIENKTRNSMLVETEKPNNANSVIAVLTAAAMDVPSLVINRALSRLEMMVQPATVIVTKFA